MSARSSVEGERLRRVANKFGFVTPKLSALLQEMPKVVSSFKVEMLELQPCLFTSMISIDYNSIKAHLTKVCLLFSQILISCDLEMADSKQTKEGNHNLVWKSSLFASLSNLLILLLRQMFAPLSKFLILLLCYRI